MSDEAAVEEMCGLYCQELIGQLWFGKDMLISCPSMPSLPIAPEYCVNGTEQDIGHAGLWQTDRAGAMQEVKPLDN